MTTEAPVPAADAKPVKKMILQHPGERHGALHTLEGVLKVGETLEVTEAYGRKLMAANPHLRDASQLATAAAKIAADEKASLEATIKDLEGKLAAAGLGQKSAEDKAAEASTAAAARIADLGARLKAFVVADKKDLAALQKEHADAVKDLP